MIVTKERILVIEIKESEIDLFISAIKKVKENAEQAGFKAGILNPDESELIKDLHKSLEP